MASSRSNAVVPGATVVPRTTGVGSGEHTGARSALHTAPVRYKLARDGEHVATGAVCVQVLPNCLACFGRLAARARADTTEGVAAAGHRALVVPVHDANKRHKPSRPS